MLIYAKEKRLFVMEYVIWQLAPEVLGPELVILHFQSDLVGRSVSRITSVHLPASAATGFRPINQLAAVYWMSSMYHAVIPGIDR